MKKNILAFLTLLIVSIQLLFSQISISEIENVEKTIFVKPEPYDSSQKWEYYDNVTEYKKYIGLQVYIPPFENPTFGSTTINNNVIFSSKPSLLNINKENEKLRLRYSWHQTSSNKSDWKTIEFEQIYSIIYSPYHYGSFSRKESDFDLSCLSSFTGLNVDISNSNELSNKYYTIIDLLYGNKLKKTLDNLDSMLNVKIVEVNKHIKLYKRGLYDDFDSPLWENYSQKIIVVRPKEVRTERPNKLFVLRNDINGDTLYCMNVQKFICVPYFVWLKNNFKSHNFIYGIDNSYDSKEESDLRFKIKSEDANGNEISSYKKVIVEVGSKWHCVDVSLIKPKFELNYILKNEKDEQITLTNLVGFVDEVEYFKMQEEKKSQSEQLLAKQKQENLEREEKLKKEKENHLNKCISLFGQVNGSLIAQGKVSINMSKDMCKLSWGGPLWTNKTTTETGVSEDWYYGLGSSLHFENDLLKRIEE